MAPRHPLWVFSPCKTTTMGAHTAKLISHLPTTLSLDRSTSHAQAQQAGDKLGMQPRNVDTPRYMVGRKWQKRQVNFPTSKAVGQSIPHLKFSHVTIFFSCDATGCNRYGPEFDLLPPSYFSAPLYGKLPLGRTRDHRLWHDLQRMDPGGLRGAERYSVPRIRPHPRPPACLHTDCGVWG